MSVVEPILQPDAALMRRHLDHLFGGHAEGQIELAWTNATPGRDGKYALANAEWFPVADLDAVVARAVELNRTPMVNVYVGAAIRHPDANPFHRSHDSDAWRLTGLYVDLDDPGSIERAREVWMFMKPTLIVGTGTTPHLRAQAYWKLDTPLEDHRAWTAMLKALARALGGDMSVTNPGRVLRLAGTVAWPVKEGRKTELTFIATTTTAPAPAPCYGIKTLAAYFRYDPADMAASGPAAPRESVDEVVTRRTNSLGLDDRITDGREKYMVKTLFACFIEYVGTNGAVPTVEDLVEAAWPQYERKVDLTRPGRGLPEMRAKAAYLIARFERGELRGMADIDDVVNAYRGRRQEAAGDYAASDFGSAASGGAEQPAQRRIRSHRFGALITEHVEEEPDYIEPGFAGPGNFVLIAGPPKAQKSFLLQEMLVAAATGGEFLVGTFQASRPLRVYWLQAEMNEKLLRKRARDLRLLPPAQIELLNANMAVSDRFHMLLDESGVQVTADAINAEFPDGPPDIIAMDPFANLFDGESENDNAQIMRFLVQRVERVRQLVNPQAVIVMVHHATKARLEDMARDPFSCIRGAGSLRGYYDSAIVIYRKGEEGKARRVHFELRSGESPEPLEVEYAGGRFQKANALTEVTKDKCRDILDGFRQAWADGEPWSPHERSKPEGRYAVDNIIDRFGLTREAAATLVAAWQRNRIITFRARVYRKHPSGFEVTGGLD